MGTKEQKQGRPGNEATLYQLWKLKIWYVSAYILPTCVINIYVTAR